ncbi:2 iron, 2 sulfur cluster Hypothetical protein [Nesidiocoris tenuis]|uniref:FAD-binding PCMH-type domain-containing protein n=2 Tax=Nesidiocoris tenuis TaxID=355587 RepID=A0ABN7B1A9_9HEMI|nr:2 iron, 2 sulfur cluster Hypothetical protein [Nesidiocoris tenuis]
MDGPMVSSLVSLFSPLVPLSTRVSVKMGQSYSQNLSTLDVSSFGNEVEFKINGKSYKANDVPPETSLNAFIREHAHLKGTKFMCLEGGCGACIVSVKSVHPKTGKEMAYAVNSCLVPVLACHGWSVTTVEGLGNKSAGYHKVQKRLAAANGTQCGYCSPGMVMNMHSILEKKPDITMKEVENSFGGNICRCTGYRPILDGFKSLASDAPEALCKKMADIEDMVCPKSKEKNLCNGSTCGNKCCGSAAPNLPGRSVLLTLENGAAWYRPISLKEVCELFDMIGEKSYRFVAGHTGQGVYRIKTPPDVYIDVNGVPELHEVQVHSEGITLGGNVSLTETMELFQNLAKEQPGKFLYCKTLADHIDLIANVPVRNCGTLAGNLSLKHEYEEFPSDIFLIFETVGAKMLLGNPSGVDQTVEMLEYMETDMNKKFISKIMLPVLDSNYYVCTSYKIMPRAQNAHAYVNAGFLFKFDKQSYTVLEKPSIVFGGINSKFTHASKTERYLQGKKIQDPDVLKESLQILESELRPDHIPPDASPKFRKGLAVSLFYKFVLSVNPAKVGERNKSGGEVFCRPVSTGKQDYETDQKLWPLNKPIPKIEAVIQCAGEAEYSNDMPAITDQLWGQLVLCDRAGATIKNIDASNALKMPGVKAFFTAKDIPGMNSFILPNDFHLETEALFVDLKTDYAGQAVGIIVADTHARAIEASKKVSISYSNTPTPEVDMKRIIKMNMKDRIRELAKIDPQEQKKDIKYTLKGTWYPKAQYHYTMEPLTCVVVPNEDNLDVYPSSQWPSSVQEQICLVLGVPENKINVRVKRLGGGYGSKIDRANHTAVAAALAAHKLHRPVRLVLNIEKNMSWMGKRTPTLCEYEVGVNDDGVIQYMDGKMYHDDGHSPNAFNIIMAVAHLPGPYDSSTWNIRGYGVKTDTACNCFCRAPGSVEAISFIDNVMEHIAKIVKKDPLEVKFANMNKDETFLRDLATETKQLAEFEQRQQKIKTFNDENRWKKRGMSIMVMKYPYIYLGSFTALVTIYGLDGSVAISHGGIEMGQGLNTKAAQVAAHVLGVDLENVSVKPTRDIVGANNAPTGASLGSECVAYAVKMCCDELNKRLAPIRAELGDKATWRDVINKAYMSSVNLTYSYMWSKDSGTMPYFIYGTTVTEVEVDVLTGQYQILRVDLMEDCGQSMSPEVDVGQAEGAFIMGLGYFTSEELVHDSDTGVLLTNRTWNYKPPGAKDIPQDFRVYFKKNAPNPYGILKSKATGEPPLCMSASIAFALREAVIAARKEAGKKDEDWIDMDLPYTVERVWLNSLAGKEYFTI